MTIDELATLARLNPADVSRVVRMLDPSVARPELDRGLAMLVLLYATICRTGMDDVIVLDLLRRNAMAIRSRTDQGRDYVGVLSVVDGRYAQYCDGMAYDTVEGTDCRIEAPTYCFTVFLSSLLDKIDASFA